jgi:hypothetical protein
MPWSEFADYSTQEKRVNFGQPDPVDEAHFTILYTCDDQKGLIDGWLLNDDEVYLRIRYGPAITHDGEMYGFSQDFAKKHGAKIDEDIARSEK